MKTIKSIIFLTSIIISSSLIYASEIIIPGAQIEKGKGSINLFYNHSTQKLSLQVSSLDEIVVGANRYFSKVSNDFECDGEANSVGLKFIMNPQDGMYYWIKLGAGFYDIEIPSVTVTNKLSGRNNGWLLGIGFRKNLFPDTIVTPATAVELAVNHSIYDLDTFSSGNNKQLVSNRLTFTEIQVAALASKKYGCCEPYGGLKVFRTYTTLIDRNDTGKVSGTKDNAGLFVGAKIKVYKKEAIVVEGSFVGETTISAGWNLEF